MADSSTQAQGDDSANTTKRIGKYGGACVGCRKRKQRCDAKQPICSRCERLNEECVYEAVRNQLASSQIIPTIQATFRFLHQISQLDAHDRTVDIPAMARDFLQRTNIPGFADISSPVSRGGQTEDEGDKDRPIQSSDGQPLPSAGSSNALTATPEDDTRDADIDELLMHMSLVDDNQNAHFGVTSFLWQTPSPSVVRDLHRRASQHPSHSKQDFQRSRAVGSREDALSAREELWATEDDVPMDTEGVGALKMNSEMLEGWTNLAYHKMELDRGAAEARTIMHLLKTYWCWLNPQHCILYPPVFYRDMALGGQYFNEFLLNVICAAACNYSDVTTPNESGAHATVDEPGSPAAQYLARAKALLTIEMDKPSSIPTIQGLMILGLGECSKGNLSQGWQYTGMSFRAMRDLGIHLDCIRLPIFGFGTMSMEDREMRRRLFWSAFTWDKIISLALGRTPTFNAWQNVSPGLIVDDAEDDVEWSPVFWQNSLPINMILYPPQKSYITSNYRHFSKLCEIVQKMIMRLYDGRPRRLQNVPFVQTMKRKLASWYDQLPPFLKLDTQALPEHCPPPHIFSTNALYRAAWILLYRTFLPHAWPVRLSAPPEIASEASEMCTKVAEELHLLFMLYHKSFNLCNMTYTVLWSMYSAATINTLDFRSQDAAVSSKASARLVFSIHVLERGSQQCPGIKRSVHAIKQQLRQPAPRPAKRPREGGNTPSRPLIQSASSTTPFESTLPLQSSTSSTQQNLPDEWDEFFQSLQLPDLPPGADSQNPFNPNLDPITTSQTQLYNGTDILQSGLAMPSSQYNVMDAQAWSHWWGDDWVSPSSGSVGPFGDRL